MIPEQVRVVEQLAACARELDHLSREVAGLDMAHVEALADYRTAYARAFLIADGSVEERKQKAILVAEDERFQADVAEQKVRACRDRIRALRDRLEVGRSLNAAVRTQFTTEAVGQP
ncbi:hypothetical protein HMPREF1484_02024 [Dermabacter sp. HFH0086]|uniref:hypothetical protein n=1 Tax=Dermabacter TaxID=36739 RepID=UPI000353B9C9|nr:MULTISPECIES: hypothetical protein [Dermabacter]EPH14715.1 hypothetical protein HMPREF1484_02024 [Dermabacter sp. HFH0086]